MMDLNVGFQYECRLYLQLTGKRDEMTARPFSTASAKKCVQG